jgi:N6-adenosine-specific RNA methylase IME4
MTEPYRVIAADCPWLFDDNLPGKGRGASKHYGCLTTYEICKLCDWDDRIPTIMDQPIADDAVLFLWRVASMQQAALDVVRAWGFTVKTEIVWLKKTSEGQRWFGMGRITRAEHETCLVCTRGRPEVLDHSIRSTFTTDFEGLSAKAGRHSEKPEAFYDIVEKLYKGPYLELFARRQRPGWTCLGLEAGAA